VSSAQNRFEGLDKIIKTSRPREKVLKLSSRKKLKMSHHKDKNSGQPMEFKMPFSIANLRANYIEKSTSRTRTKGHVKKDNITLTERLYSDAGLI